VTKLHLNRGHVLYFRDAIILFRPKHLQNKFEPNSVKYEEGSAKKEDIESWINKN
jgi:protein disulfide isomerase family A protein 3